jgi:hypothetical protein
MIGNAVPVRLAYYLAKEIKNSLSGNFLLHDVNSKQLEKTV